MDMGKQGKILDSILFLVMLAIFTGAVSAADWNVSDRSILLNYEKGCLL